MPPLSNNNLTQIFLALLPDALTGQNCGKKEKLNELKDVLKLDVDINVEILPGFTPLCKTIEGFGSKALVELLLESGAKIMNDDQTLNQSLALAKARYQKYQDQESFEIQKLLENTLEKIEHDKKITQDQALIAEERSNKKNFMNDNKIFIFDFDNTLVNGNFNAILSEMGVQAGRASKDLVEFLLEKYGIKNKGLLFSIFKQILNAKDHICIAHKTLYPETILGTLRAIGLEQHEMSKVFYMETFESQNGHNLGRNPQILKAMLHFGVMNVNTVFLIFPDTEHLELAKNKLNIPSSNLIQVKTENQNINHLYQIQNVYKKNEVVELKNSKNDAHMEKEQIKDLNFGKSTNTINFVPYANYE